MNPGLRSSITYEGFPSSNSNISPIGLAWISIEVFQSWIQTRPDGGSFKGQSLAVFLLEWCHMARIRRLTDIAKSGSGSHRRSLSMF